jgi:hypothetical protein
MATAAPLAPIPPDPFRRLPRTTTTDGRPRRVGVEVEFAGLSVDDASAVVQRVYGGEIVPVHRFSTEVRGTALGDFRVEVDSKPLQDQRYRAFLDRIGAGSVLTGVVEDVLEGVLRQWVPSEIVSAPLEIDGLERIEELRWALFAADAQGTRASPLYGFAFQLNPEVPALDAHTLTRYLRAYLALQDWLAAVVDVDPTRRFGPFVDPFPIAYRRLLLERDYAPDLDGLIADYLVHSPTRNRGLDMLPVFATLRHDVVLAGAKEHDQIKPRPTFHYRLPNCLVDDPAWAFAVEWNRWVEVERLAEDPVRLERACSEALEMLADEAALEPASAIARARAWGVEAP